MCKLKEEFLRRPLFFLSLALIIPLYIISLIKRNEPANFRTGDPFYGGGIISEKNSTSLENRIVYYVEATTPFVLIVNSPREELALGMEIKVSGVIKPFDEATSPGEYDAHKYYFSKGYNFSVIPNRIEVTHSPCFPLSEFLYRLRQTFCNVTKLYCPLEYPTINTLLFGYKGDLSSDRKDNFQAAGIAHFLVISGIHMSVAGGGIYLFLKRIGLRRSLSAIIGISFILFYGGLVGYSVSVLRSVIMYLIRLIADILGRSYDILTALSIAFLICVVRNPNIIVNTAFEYSYGAVFIIAVYNTYLREEYRKMIMKNVTERSGFNYKFHLTLYRSVPLFLIYLGLLPIGLYSQSYSNLLSIPINLLLGLFTVPILISAFLAFSCSSIHFAFGAGLFDFFCALMLRFIDFISGNLSCLRFFHIVYKPSPETIIIYYIIIFILVFALPLILSPFIGYVVVFSSIWFLGNNLNPYLCLSAINVNQGDCILIQIGRHRAIMCDCGSTGKSDISKRVVLPYLMSKGITDIDDIFISHEDSDHINGIEYLLTNERGIIKVHGLIFPSGHLGERIDFLTSLASERGIKTATIARGDQVSYGSLQILCLNPVSQTEVIDENESSMVLWVMNNEFDILLTGDSTKETEAGLSFPNRKLDVLKVAHHGSRTSTSEAFVAQLKPKIALISVGRNNRYGHPTDEVLERLYKYSSYVYRTDLDGTVEIPIK